MFGLKINPFLNLKNHSKEWHENVEYSNFFSLKNSREFRKELINRFFLVASQNLLMQASQIEKIFNESNEQPDLIFTDVHCSGVIGFAKKKNIKFVLIHTDVLGQYGYLDYLYLPSPDLYPKSVQETSSIVGRINKISRFLNLLTIYLPYILQFDQLRTSLGFPRELHYYPKIENSLVLVSDFGIAIPRVLPPNVKIYNFFHIKMNFFVFL